MVSVSFTGGGSTTLPMRRFRSQTHLSDIPTTLLSIVDTNTEWPISPDNWQTTFLFLAGFFWSVSGSCSSQAPHLRMSRDWNFAFFFFLTKYTGNRVLKIIKIVTIDKQCVIVVFHAAAHTGHSTDSTPILAAHGVVVSRGRQRSHASSRFALSRRSQGI